MELTALNWNPFPTLTNTINTIAARPKLTALVLGALTICSMPESLGVENTAIHKVSKLVVFSPAPSLMKLGMNMVIRMAEEAGPLVYNTLIYGAMAYFVVRAYQDEITLFVAGLLGNNSSTNL